MVVRLDVAVAVLFPLLFSVKPIVLLFLFPGWREKTLQDEKSNTSIQFLDKNFSQ